MTEPAPLHSIEAEQQVIGALLFKNELYWESCTALQPEHFADAMHALIFGAIVEAIKSSAIASPVTIAGKLATVEGFDKDYIASCARSATVAGLSDHADLIRGFAAMRTIAEAGEQMAARARGFGLADSPEDIIAEAEENIRSLSESATPSKAELIGAGGDAWLEGLNDPKRQEVKVSTGLDALDRTIGGFQPGLFVMAGRPSMGKTAMALGLARGALMNGHGVYMPSMEMDRQRLRERLVADLAYSMEPIEYEWFRKPHRWTEAQMRAAREANDMLKGVPFLVDSRPGQSADYIIGGARKAKRQFEARGFPLSLVVVDYLQLMQIDRTYSQNIPWALGQISKAMKRLSTELGCAVLLLSQLNRQVEAREDKRPNMSDLKQSGAIEEDADVIGFLLRPEYYVQKDERATDAERADAANVLRLFIDKNRNGATCTLDFMCRIGCNVVRDRMPEASYDYGRAA